MQVLGNLFLFGVVGFFWGEGWVFFGCSFIGMFCYSVFGGWFWLCFSLYMNTWSLMRSSFRFWSCQFNHLRSYHKNIRRFWQSCASSSEQNLECSFGKSVQMSGSLRSLAYLESGSYLGGRRFIPDLTMVIIFTLMFEVQNIRVELRNHLMFTFWMEMAKGQVPSCCCSFPIHQFSSASCTPVQDGKCSWGAGWKMLLGCRISSELWD